MKLKALPSLNGKTWWRVCCGAKTCSPRWTISSNSSQVSDIETKNALTRRLATSSPTSASWTNWRTLSSLGSTSKISPCQPSQQIAATSSSTPIEATTVATRDGATPRSPTLWCSSVTRVRSLQGSCTAVVSASSWTILAASPQTSSCLP